jgi:iron(III) transport system substrate-binding protein
VKGIAKNDPVLTGEDEDVAAGVSAPNQSQVKIGLLSTAKFRDIEEKKYDMRVCEGLQPWSGFMYPKYATIATGSKHPNAAKLFVHFAMTKEGFSLEAGSGGMSGNKEVGQSPNTPPGLTDWPSELYRFSPESLPADFRARQEMQDFWRVNHAAPPPPGGRGRGPPGSTLGGIVHGGRRPRTAGVTRPARALPVTRASA